MTPLQALDLIYKMSRMAALSADTHAEGYNAFMLLKAELEPVLKELEPVVKEPEEAKS